VLYHSQDVWKYRLKRKEITGVWKDGLHFVLRPDGKSSVGRPKYRRKVMLRAKSV